MAIGSKDGILKTFKFEFAAGHQHGRDSLKKLVAFAPAGEIKVGKERITSVVFAQTVVNTVFTGT